MKYFRWIERFFTLIWHFLFIIYNFSKKFLRKELKSNDSTFAHSSFGIKYTKFQGSKLQDFAERS